MVMTLLVSFLFSVSVFADDISFLVGTDEEKPYLFEDKTSQVLTDGNDVSHRFADGTNYFTYKFDLDKTKTQGTVTLLISNDYLVSVSTDNQNWEKAVADETGIHDHTNKMEEEIDISKYLTTDATAVYVKISDQNTSDGWGGAVWEVNVSFSGSTDATPSPETTEAPTTQATTSAPATEAPETTAPTGGDQEPEGGNTTLIIIIAAVVVVGVAAIALFASKKKR